MTTASINPTATSGQSDGAAAFSANPATIVIGGAAPNKHGLLRFDTSVIPESETIVEAHLTVKVSAVGAGTPPDIALWGSDFGAAIGNPDYNQPESLTPKNKIGLRAYIDLILLGSDGVGDTGMVYIPTQYIIKDTGGFCDLELRPDVATAGATDTLTIHGPNAASALDKPLLYLRSRTDAELLAENDDRDTGIGAEAWLCFAQETDKGVPVKGLHFVDLTNSSLDGDAQTIFSTSMRRERSDPVKMALGASGAQGSFGCEATPERCWILLLGFMKVESTTSLGTIEGNDGNDYTVFEREFRVAQMREVQTFTFIQKSAEAFRYVYPGCFMDTMSISTGVGRAVDLAFSMLARDEWTYDIPSAGENDRNIIDPNAAYDLNAQMVYTGVEIEKNGVVDHGRVQTFNITMANNAEPLFGLRRKRSVRKHFAGKFQVALDYTMEFNTDDACREFLGVRHKDGPYKAEKSIRFSATKYKLAGPLGEDVQEIVFEFPKMIFATIRKPLASQGVIMLNCRGVGTFSPADFGSLVVTHRSTEAASVFLPSDDRITVQPLDR